MNKFRISVLLLLSFLLSGKTFAQLSNQEVDQLVGKIRTQFNIAGVAVGIVKDGKVYHSKGYGLQSLTSRKKVDAHTQFAIASNTKAFTATALAILVEQGKISWQDKVIEHIPEFKMYNSYVTENFNIQDLLTHRSGLGIGAGDLMFIPGENNFTIQDILTNFQHFEPQSSFRTKYDYDNLLYIVAGELIARVSGMSWEAFIMKNIVAPLGMDDTYSTLSMMSDKNNLATPYLLDEKKLQPVAHSEFTGNGAAGGIYSCVDDLNQWMLLHLNQGTYGKEQQLFSLASQREMWKIHTPFTTYPNPRYQFHFAGYGLGWELRDIRGNMVAHHGGLLPGMASQTTLVPDLNLGIVVLMNTADETGFSPVDAITYTLLDSYLGLEDFEWSDKVFNAYKNKSGKTDSLIAAVWKTVEQADSRHLNPADYTGIYEDPWFGQVEVFLNEGALWFKSYRSPKLNGKMSFYKANAFAIQWEYQDMNADAFAIFSLDEEGRAQGIKMKGISPDMDFSFDFQDLDFKRVEAKEHL